MKVKAPFHVGEDFDHDWLLFALRVELSFIDETVWDYFKCQRLVTQAQRLTLRSEFEKWLSRRKFCRKKRNEQARYIPLP